MDKIKTALIGHGHLGKWHAQKTQLINLAQLVVICEKNKDLHHELIKMYPDVEITDSMDNYWNKIDACIIVTPTIYHKNVVIEALKNKKHIFCEKPLCNSFDESIEIEKLLDSNLIFQVGHSERVHEIWNQLRFISEKNTANWQMTINRYAPFKGRATDVDVIADLMVHDIDLMLYLTNKWPVEVYACAQKIHSKNYDICDAFFYFDDGSSAHIHNGRAHHVERRELLVACNHNHYIVDLMNSEMTHVKDNGASNSTSYLKRDHLLYEQSRFFESITTNKEIFVNFIDGKRAVYLIDKVREAARSKQKVQIRRI